jgi:hypothetical protein
MVLLNDFLVYHTKYWHNGHRCRHDFSFFCLGANDMHGFPELERTVAAGNALLLNFMARHPWGHRLSQVT